MELNIETCLNIFRDLKNMFIEQLYPIRFVMVVWLWWVKNGQHQRPK